MAQRRNVGEAKAMEESDDDLNKDKNEVWNKLKHVKKEPINGMIRFNYGPIDSPQVEQYLNGKWYPIEARN